MIYADLQEQRDLLALLCLPFYFGLYPHADKNVTREDVLDSFILMVKDENDERSRISKLHEIYKACKISFVNSPLVIVRGDIETVSKSFVLLNDFEFSCEEPIDAVQFCFKIYKALHLPFPTINYHIWSFLQKQIFHITLDSGVSVVDELCKKLSSLEKHQVKKIKI